LLQISDYLYVNAIFHIYKKHVKENVFHLVRYMANSLYYYVRL
jgi:hypothetical protein